MIGTGFKLETLPCYFIICVALFLPILTPKLEALPKCPTAFCIGAPCMIQSDQKFYIFLVKKVDGSYIPYACNSWFCAPTGCAESDCEPSGLLSLYWRGASAPGVTCDYGCTTSDNIERPGYIAECKDDGNGPVVFGPGCYQGCSLKKKS